MGAADAVHPRWADLTQREREVLAEVARRFTNAEIADEFRVSKRTIESHISALYRKLGVSTRRALIAAGQPASRNRHRPSPRQVRSGPARAAFDQAVRTERMAIATHEAAGMRLDRLAAELEADALLDRNEQVRGHAVAVAARARRRAAAARERAEVVRRRLRDEGAHPDA